MRQPILEINKKLKDMQQLEDKLWQSQKESEHNIQHSNNAIELLGATVMIRIIKRSNQ